MSKSIFLIISSSGEWEDYRSWVEEKAFVSEYKAKEYAKEIDKKHNKKAVINESLWNEVNSKFDELCDKNPDLYENKYKYGTNKWSEEHDRLTKLEQNTYLQILHDMGYLQYTIDDIINQLVYEDTKYEIFYPCEIKKIDLDEEE